MRVSRPLTMPTRGRWRTGPAIGRATAPSGSGGFCRKSGRTEICAGQDAQFVARALADAGMLRTQAEGLQCNVRVGDATTSGLRRHGGYFRRGGRCGLRLWPSFAPSCAGSCPGRNTRNTRNRRVFSAETPVVPSVPRVPGGTRHVGNRRFEPGTFPEHGTRLDVAEAERAAIAIELGRVPPAYADAWAAFQTRKPGQCSRGRMVSGRG